MEIKVEELDGMSQKELESLEDEVVLSETETPEETTDKSEAEESKESEKKEVETDTASGENLTDGDEEITKHISPPSKWAAQRQALRESKTLLEENERINEELEELKLRASWVESQAQAKGVDTTKTPADILSPEKIANVREEYGDELADMFQAVRGLNGQGINNIPKQAVPEDQNQHPAQQPIPQYSVDETAEMQRAISDNDDLSYWQQHSKALWDKAVETNEQFLKDPGYVALSFNERFQYVVNKVQSDALELAKTTTPGKQKEDSGLPPESLSGKGSAPTITDNNSIDRILDASPADQAKIYAGLSEAERDKVDMELGI